MQMKTPGHRIIPTANTSPVPGRQLAQGHSKLATDPELNDSRLPHNPLVLTLGAFKDERNNQSSETPPHSPSCPEKEQIQRRQQVKSNHSLFPFASEHGRESMEESHPGPAGRVADKGIRPLLG